MALQREETELGKQLLDYLYQYPDNWLKDYELYESFKSYSKKSIHNHLSMLCQGKLVQRTRYCELETAKKEHFQFYTYRIDQEVKTIIDNVKHEKKAYLLSLVGLMLAALALVTAFKIF